MRSQKRIVLLFLKGRHLIALLSIFAIGLPAYMMAQSYENIANTKTPLHVNMQFISSTPKETVAERPPMGWNSWEDLGLTDPGKPFSLRDSLHGVGQFVVLPSEDRGEVGTYNNRFIWTATEQAFVPNLIMYDALVRNATFADNREKPDPAIIPGNNSDLRFITEKNVDRFIDEFIKGHGFNGVHVPVFGQWFHIGDNVVSENDTIPDPRTFEKLALLIKKVYEAGGSTYLWVWGDDQRNWTANSTKGGIMGKQEKLVMDMIAEKLGPLKGWFMGYGFDCWEWVNEKELKEWHDYLWAKPGWNKLLGARADKNELNQLYEGLDFSSYAYFKPSYFDLVKMINARPWKPSLSGDRYRVRPAPSSKVPEKDYNIEETRRGLWYHTMAGGIGAIWGNLNSQGIYPNREALKCFSIFWNDKNRFRKDMVIDNSLTNGYCLRELDNHYVFYKEDTNEIAYKFSGKSKRVIAVDTKKKYQEISLGKKKPGRYVFEAPYTSDWAIAVELN